KMPLHLPKLVCRRVRKTTERAIRAVGVGRNQRLDNSLQLLLRRYARKWFPAHREEQRARRFLSDIRFARVKILEQISHDVTAFEPAERAHRCALDDDVAGPGKREERSKILGERGTRVLDRQHGEETRGGSAGLDRRYAHDGASQK